LAPPTKPIDPAGDAVAHALRCFLATGGASVAGRPRIAVALSGGCDSMVLLDTLAAAAPAFGVELSAIHVHHGLSPNADAWTDFCARECAARSVPLATRRIVVDRRPGASLEAGARAARRAIFAGLEVDAVALAHHADDQAETLWLQLLRGAGPHGLAAMSADRAPRDGPRILRPLLSLSRATIAAAARARGLDWVEDESNADLRIKRNFIRREISPRLAQAFPGYPGTLLRTASHQAEAALLIDELAAQDAIGALAQDPVDGPTLDRSRLGSLAPLQPHRARNLLRWFLRQHGLRAPSAARVGDMLSQLTTAAVDARVRIAHEDREIGIHRGFVFVHAAVGAWPALEWRDGAAIDLPHGTLALREAGGGGIALRHFGDEPVIIRRRQGGEHLRLGPERPRQSLTHLMQQRGIPHWRRDTWPLVFFGNALAEVPAIGVDAAFAAAPGTPGRSFDWAPHTRRPLARILP
jgi:tRNA(Ile)-lysidine synthase